MATERTPLPTPGSSLLVVAIRRAKDAATRVDRAVTFLRHEANEATPHSERAWLIGYEAENLLWSVLRDAHSLVDLLNDDRGDGAEAAAKAVYEALRARRLAAKLENVEGRTAEETEAFQAKARELRGMTDRGTGTTQRLRVFFEAEILLRGDEIPADMSNDALVQAVRNETGYTGIRVVEVTGIQHEEPTS